MNSQFLSWFPLFSILVILEISVLVRIPLCSSDPDVFYETCGTAFSCGNISGIGYPFRGNGSPEYCGYPGLVLNCNQDNITTIEIMGMAYCVLAIDQTIQFMRIAREDLMESRCPQDLVNTTLDYTLFDYASANYMNVTFIFGCPVSMNFPGLSSLTCGSNGYSSVYLLPELKAPEAVIIGPIPGFLNASVCNINNTDINAFYVMRNLPIDPRLGRCNSTVIVPIFETTAQALEANRRTLGLAIDGGFGLQWDASDECSRCLESGGECGHNRTENRFTCFCNDQPGLETCSDRPGLLWCNGCTDDKNRDDHSESGILDPYSPLGASALHGIE
ncbi:hypothetical protein RJ639_018789 [Escallonia herrerae]|uniref:non-specific serine/threonine protein kinase n=1 Tax=Escallonia herrerae TaxID=1293975 RepID=A0AA88VCG4_9ASTE|nr:hypothetical protein RJ639_018789 [Escallonia herrerae]